MRSVTYPIGDRSAFASMLCAMPQELPAPEPVLDGEELLVTFEVIPGGRATAATARAFVRGGDAVLAFERRDWERLLRFVEESPSAKWAPASGRSRVSSNAATLPVPAFPISDTEQELEPETEQAPWQAHAHANAPPWVETSEEPTDVTRTRPEESDGAASAGFGALEGRVIANKYVIESLLGGGATGAVYLARQRSLDKRVAVKILHRELAQDPVFLARFRREARAASRLEHPNSVRVIDYGEEPDGLLFIAMEYLYGRDLLRVIDEDWPLPPERIAHIMMQVLAALAAAHDVGIIHRDLKPENVMVLRALSDDGQPTDMVKVCDFGIAKELDARSWGSESAHLTTQGVVVGTPEYMSPEQAQGEPVDARSDVYAAGIVLYFMLTRALPFDGGAPMDILLRHVTQPPKRPSAIAPEIDPRLEEICLRALRKRPAERYGSAREMRAALRAIEGSVSTGSGPHADLPLSRGSIKALMTSPVELHEAQPPASSRPSVRSFAPTAISHPPQPIVPHVVRPKRLRIAALASLPLLAVLTVVALRAREAPVSASAPRTGAGHVSLQTTGEPCAIAIDGIEQGATPLEIDLPAGAHHVICTAVRSTQSIEVHVEDGTAQRIPIVTDARDGG